MSGKHSDLQRVGFKMDDSLSTASKRIKQAAVNEFLIHENEIPIGIHWWLLAVHGEDNVGILCAVRGNGGNVGMNNHL